MFQQFWRSFSKHFSKPPSQVVASVDPLSLMLSAAHTQFQKNNYEESEFLVVRAFEQTSEETDPRIIDWIVSILNNIWFRQEADAKAINFFSKLVPRVPNSAVAHHALAVHLFRSGQLQQALREYDSSLALSSGNALALSARGQILAELGESQKAITDLEQALEILNRVPNAREPHWAETEAYTRNGLGLARAAAGNYQEAMHQFELSIALRPENAWVYFNRARAHERQDNFDEALTDYRQALTRTQPRLPAYKREFAEDRIRQLTSDRS